MEEERMNMKLAGVHSQSIHGDYLNDVSVFFCSSTLGLISHGLGWLPVSHQDIYICSRVYIMLVKFPAQVVLEV